MGIVPILSFFATLAIFFAGAVLYPPLTAGELAVACLFGGIFIGSAYERYLK